MSTSEASRPTVRTYSIYNKIFGVIGKTKNLSGDWRHFRVNDILSTQKRNLLAGIHNGSAEYAQKMIDKGFNLVTVGSDSRYIGAGAKLDLEKLKGIKISKAKGY